MTLGMRHTSGSSWFRRADTLHRLWNVAEPYTASVGTGHAAAACLTPSPTRGSPGSGSASECARPHTNPPHYRVPNEDAFRHVAEAYGDDNPLWCDPSYGAGTRWAGPIAPPHLVGGDTLIGEDEITALEGETKALMKGDPLGGVHAFYSGSFREWWNPLRPAMRVTRRNALVGVHDKVGEFAGRTVHEWLAESSPRPTVRVLSGQYRLMIRAEREKATERKKNDEVEIRAYTDEEMAAIGEAVAGERAQRRGAAPAGGKT